jgi:ryanodine receptor 2
VSDAASGKNPDGARAAGYVPAPVDTSAVSLPVELDELTEVLARNAHDLWARLRLEQGWRWGPARDDVRKEHPALVPYEALPESEKQADRETAVGTLKAILAFGYRIDKVTGTP